MSKRLGKLKKLLRGKAGFTILELMIVLVIIMFLAAMVAPRFAGILNRSSGSVDAGNMSQVASALSTFQNAHNRMPNNLINLVPTEVNTAAVGPLVDFAPTGDNAWVWTGGMEDSQKGGVFTNSFNRGFSPRVHELNAAEVTGLKDLGITKLHDMHTGAEKNIESGDKVLMIGAGAAEAADFNADNTSATAPGYGPDLMYRIMLGLGENSTVVTDGTLEASGIAPGGARYSEYASYSKYTIVLPRLAATTLRIGTGATIGFNVAEFDPVAMNYVYYHATDNPDAYVTANVKTPQTLITAKTEVISPDGMTNPLGDMKMWGTIVRTQEL